MNSSMRFLVWGTIPLGALVGGALATAFGVRRRSSSAQASAVRARSFRSCCRRSGRCTTSPSRTTSRCCTSPASSRSWAVPLPPTPSALPCRMPELPEMEAWRRQLNDPVSAFPIAKAGPAHIATLKTFDPPLDALEGRRFRGAERRGKRLLFPTEDGELVLARPPDDARAGSSSSRPARKARRRLRSRSSSRAARSSSSRRTQGRSAPASGCSRPRRRRPSSRTSGRRRSGSGRSGSARSSTASRGGCMRCCATST